MVDFFFFNETIFLNFSCGMAGFNIMKLRDIRQKLLVPVAVTSGAAGALAGGCAGGAGGGR